MSEVKWTPSWFTVAGVYWVNFSGDNCYGRKPLPSSESDLGNLVFAFYDNLKDMFKVYLYTKGTSEYNTLLPQWVEKFITSAELTDTNWFDFFFPENLSVEPNVYFSRAEIFGLFDRMLYNHKNHRDALNLTDEDSRRLENMLEHLRCDKLREKYFADPEMCRELRHAYFKLQ